MRRTALRCALLLLAMPSIALAGGAGAPTTADHKAPTAIATTAALEVWEGQYTCPQGATGVRLNITEWTSDHFRAIGEMFPLPTNPKVPHGKAELWGTYDTDTGVVKLTNYRWINQPAGYELTPLSAQLSLSANYREAALSINPPNYGCTNAFLKRVR